MHFFFENPVTAIRVSPTSGLLCLDKMNMENRNGDTCIAENLEYLNHLNAYRKYWRTLISPAPGLERLAAEAQPVGTAAARRRQQEPPERVPFPGCAMTL